MALRQGLTVIIGTKVTRCTVAKSCVRGIRGYLKQHERQALSKELLAAYRTSKISAKEQSPFIGPYTEEERATAQKYKYMHPEFMPPLEPEHRDAVREVLEREDMIKRRASLEIPEFYVGTLMATTLSDPYADGGESRFVGICIQRNSYGLRHNFTLRNVIDKQGIEIMYELYNPTIKKIEVLKLEKRLDDDLSYLRDAPDIYSTVPFDIEVTPHPKGAPVPINSTKVLLNPRPWRVKWELHINKLKGVDIGSIIGETSEKRMKRTYHKQNTKPWEKYDLMKMYRESVCLEDQDEAYIHFIREHKKLENIRADRLRVHHKQETI
ncbi:large ribosomal subunit protein bL19m-like [Watersipora subatra]|uniref:large ribosomal subunit protein bL19m-like n=1 Tax=Watersipora subatra TaxID=2589382 RepID=UPI00355C033F